MRMIWFDLYIVVMLYGFVLDWGVLSGFGIQFSYNSYFQLAVAFDYSLSKVGGQSSLTG